MPSLTQPPKRKAMPVTVRPDAGSILAWLNLAQIAYIIGRATRLPVTVPWVSGAIRGLQLGLDKEPRPARVRGLVVYKQQTMVHPTQLNRIQQYIQERHS